MFLQSPDPHRADWWTSYRWYYSWGQESGTLSMLFECRSHRRWPCIILHNISTHNLLAGIRTEGLNWRQTRKPIELFCSLFLYFHIIFRLQLSVSPSTSRQTVSADTALQRSASLYTTRNQFLQAAMRKKREKRIRPVLWGEIEGQNVNFPGNPSLVGWIVKRSSNAHFDTR